jgi:hypothetical protein
MAEVDIDGVKVKTDTFYTAKVVRSFTDTSGLAWADLAINELPTFGSMTIYFHCGNFEEALYRNISVILPKGLQIQVKVRPYDQSDMREKAEFDKGWRLKVTSARVDDPDSRKQLESLPQKFGKSSKPGRIKLVPEGDESLRAASDNFHTKDILTFNESNKLDSQKVRLSATGKFTLIDLLTGSELINGGKTAKDVQLFEWNTKVDGVESLGIKFMGSRELSLRLVHVTTGEAIPFRLKKV